MSYDQYTLSKQLLWTFQQHTIHHAHLLHSEEDDMEESEEIIIFVHAMNLWNHWCPYEISASVLEAEAEKELQQGNDKQGFAAASTVYEQWNLQPDGSKENLPLLEPS